MICKSFITTLVLFNLLPLILATFCDLNLKSTAWLDDWHLILSQNENGQYQLLREDHVKDSANIFLLCGSKTLSITPVKCENKKFNVTLPLKIKCEEMHRIQRSEIVIKQSKNKKEDTHCKYDLHKIGFNVQIGGKTQFLETYQVCFDKEHMRPVFTINKAYPNVGGRPDFLQFYPDFDFYGNTFHAFDRSSLFDRFKKLLGESQNYIKSKTDHVLDRGHLTPSGDFITTTLRESTFSMINVIPQFTTINEGNWLLIEIWARDKTRTPANICTGVLDCKLNSNIPSDLNCILILKTIVDKKGIRGKAVEEKRVAMFLADNNKIPIPLWVYKIVTSKDNQRTVFLTYNNIYHEGDIQPPSNVCDEEICPSDIKLKLIRTIKNGRTFCCNYEKFLEKAVPNLKGKC